MKEGGVSDDSARSQKFPHLTAPSGIRAEGSSLQGGAGCARLLAGRAAPAEHPTFGSLTPPSTREQPCSPFHTQTEHLELTTLPLSISHMWPPPCAYTSYPPQGKDQARARMMSPRQLGWQTIPHHPDTGSCCLVVAGGDKSYFKGVRFW